MFYLFHRLGIQSNILVSGRYDGGNLTKASVLDALRTVALKHSALWHVFVYRPSLIKKAQHVLHLAALHTIDIEKCVEFVEDDGAGITTDLLERCHNEWLYTSDEPDTPWWKLVVKGHDIIFVYHHAVGDGMSGYTFHHEFLDALNSAPTPETVANVRSDYQLVRAHTEWNVPKEPMKARGGKHNVLELLWITVVVCFYMFWYSSARIYQDFPAAKKLVRKATGVAGPLERNVTQVVTHRIPASKMSLILAACREHQVTFTPVLMTMLTVVLGTEFYPKAKAGFSRYSYDLRKHLPMEQIGGGTENGVIFNASSGGQHFHRLGTFRKAIPFQAGNAKISSIRDAPLDASVVWPLAKEYKKTMTEMMNDRGIKLWYSGEMMSPSLEDFVGQPFTTMGAVLPATYHVSNLGPFSAGSGTPTEKSDREPKTWKITDTQFSVAPTNGNLGTNGIIFSLAGVRGGDAVVHATYEEGVVTRERAQDIVDRVMSRIYELA